MGEVRVRHHTVRRQAPPAVAAIPDADLWKATHLSKSHMGSMRLKKALVTDRDEHTRACLVRQLYLRQAGGHYPDRTLPRKRLVGREGASQGDARREAGLAPPKSSTPSRERLTARMWGNRRCLGRTWKLGCRICGQACARAWISCPGLTFSARRSRPPEISRRICGAAGARAIKNGRQGEHYQDNGEPPGTGRRAMEPKDVAKLLDQKSAAQAEKAAGQQAQADAKQAELQKRDARGREAMRDVVIPYLREIAAATQQFKFNAAASRDTRSKEVLGVSFRIGNSPTETFIEVSQGNVRIYGQPLAQQRGGNLKVSNQFVYPGTSEPFIATVDDLTREKLGKLVEIVNKGR
jgi:hypothetical protein